MEFYGVSVSSYLAAVKLLAKFLCNKKPYGCQTFIKIFVAPPVTDADLRRPYPGGQNARCALPSPACRRACRLPSGVSPAGSHVQYVPFVCMTEKAHVSMCRMRARFSVALRCKADVSYQSCGRMTHKTHVQDVSFVCVTHMAHERANGAAFGAECAAIVGPMCQCATSAPLFQSLQLYSKVLLYIVLYKTVRFSNL